MNEIAKTNDPEAPKPWERLDGETARAYELFTMYRNMKPLERSQRELRRLTGRGGKVIAEWSSKFHWVERAEAYDAHLDRLALEAQDARIRQLAEARAEFAVESLSFVMKRLRGDEAEGIKALDANTLSAKDIAALANAAEKVGASMDRVSADADGNRDVHVKLSFDLTPHHGAVETVDAVVVHEELPPGE